MTVFILILYFSTASTSGGMTLTTAEFQSRAACEVAAAEARKMAGWATTARHTCVPKDGLGSPTAPSARP